MQEKDGKERKTWRVGREKDNVNGRQEEKEKCKKIQEKKMLAPIEEKNEEK